MDRIAIISDIHGNMPALEAALDDIRRRGISRVFCLGDLIGKGPNPDQVVDRIREICEVVVQGNWDLGITYRQDQAEGLWHQAKLGSDRLAYLEQLPFSIDFRLSGSMVRLFHASASSVFHRVRRKASKKDRLALFDHTVMTGTPEDGRTPDIVGYGDIHIPYLTTIRNHSLHANGYASTTGKVIFNVGSVGMPYDGIPQASYCIAEGIYGGTYTAGHSIQFIRVPYDIELAIKLAKKAEMPGADRYIREITEAIVHK